MVERDVTKCGGVEWSVLKAHGVALGQMRDRSKQRTAATRIHFADQTSTKPARIQPTHTAKHTQ